MNDANASIDIPKETYSFVYGDEHIPYRVTRIKTATTAKRQIQISVPPDMQVVVSAPQDAKRQDIHDAVMKRAQWIYNNLQAFKKQTEHVQQRRYISGEMQFYLGRRYMLKVINREDTSPSVKMERGKLLVQLKKATDESDVDTQKRVKAMVQQWYLTRAQYVFDARLAALLPLTPWASSKPKYRILPMIKQWGSCSATGNLMLNPHLVKAPRDCIDYVILHELCHVKEHNHGDRFYRLLTGVLPNWRNVKQELDAMAELLLND